MIVPWESASVALPSLHTACLKTGKFRDSAQRLGEPDLLRP